MGQKPSTNKLGKNAEKGKWKKTSKMLQKMRKKEEKGGGKRKQHDGPGSERFLEDEDPDEKEHISPSDKRHFHKLNNTKIVNGACKKYKGQPTPLWIAASKNQLEVAELLLQHRSDVNRTYDPPPMTARDRADSDPGAVNPAERLTEQQADPSLLETPLTGTPLFVASFHGYTEMVALLLRYRADPNVKTRDLTPLMAAADRNHTTTCRLLLEHDADATVRKNDGATALFLACQRSNVDLELLSLLVEFKADPNVAKSGKVTPLCTAAYKGNTDVVKKLITLGADVNHTTEKGAWPLVLAAQNGHTSIIKSLLAAGPAAVPVQTTQDAQVWLQQGPTLPIVMGFFPAHHTAAAIVFENLARQMRDDYLFLTVIRGDRQLLQKFHASAKKDSIVVLAPGSQSQPMHYTGPWDRESMQSFIRIDDDEKVPDYQDDGGTGDMKTSLGERPLEANQRALIDKTLPNGATALYVAAQHGKVPATKALLGHHARVNRATDERKDTPLMVAAQQGHKHLASLLLEVRANVNQTNANGSTSLFLACHHPTQEHAGTVELLLKAGADPSLASAAGETPLHAAATKGRLQLVKKLVGHGALVDARTQDGSTALHCAARADHARVVTYLLETHPELADIRDEDGHVPIQVARTANSEEALTAFDDFFLG